MIFFSLLFQPHQTVVVFIGEESSMSVSKANKHVNKIDFSFDFYELFFLWQSIVECVRVCGRRKLCWRGGKKSYQKNLYVQFSLWNPRLLTEMCFYFFRHRFNSIFARREKPVTVTQ